MQCLVVGIHRGNSIFDPVVYLCLDRGYFIWYQTQAMLIKLSRYWKNNNYVTIVVFNVFKYLILVPIRVGILAALQSNLMGKKPQKTIFQKGILKAEFELKNTSCNKCVNNDLSALNNVNEINKLKKNFQYYLLQLSICRKLDTDNFAKLYNV